MKEALFNEGEAIKFTGLIATTNPDQDGMVFTEEALKQLAETAVGKSVSIEFRHKMEGCFVSSSSISEKGVEVEIDEPDPHPYLQTWLAKNSIYAVPAFKISYGDGTIETTSIGITRDPADESITPLKVKR